VKRRWKAALAAAGLLAAFVLPPVLYIESACTGPLPGLAANAPHRSLMPGAEGRRAEARTWLTYPEWYIVYSADSYGRFLAGGRPSAFPYVRHAAGFWSAYCAANRAAAGSPGSADATVMLYTIGFSFTAEMLAKGAYETTLGRLFEWIGGWRSAADRHGAAVQRSYGAFMHETPWYAFPFAGALSGLLATRDWSTPLRQLERVAALGTEYGAKALYGGLIGWASGATLGRDELTLRLVARADPQAVAAVDPRLRPVGRLPGGLTLVEAPRYATFTALLLKLADSRVPIVEIAGNDDIFVTLLVPETHPAPPGTVRLLAERLDDRPGWQRLGVAVKVERLLPLLRAVRGAGGEVEHVYDY